MNTHKKNGFTMIELLVATTIIAVLIAIGTVSYSSVSKRSRDSKRRSDIEQIRAALEMYRADNTNYIDDRGLAGDVLEVALVDGNYMPVIPVDPKNVQYFYNCTSSDRGNCYAYALEATMEVIPVEGSICPPSGGGNYCIPNP